MMITKKLAPPHSLLLVMDPAAGDPPRSMGKRVVAATRSCVAIGTLCEVDGETTVVLSNGPETSGVAAKMELAFDGVIAAPSREVHLCTTATESIAKLPVPTTTARVQVWTNRSVEPDRILIVMSGS